MWLSDPLVVCLAERNFLGQTVASRCGFPTFRGLTLSPCEGFLTLRGLTLYKSPSVGTLLTGTPCRTLNFLV